MAVAVGTAVVVAAVELAALAAVRPFEPWLFADEYVLFQ